MSYSVFIKSGGTRYKLPVNPEEIKKTTKINVEKYQVLGSGQVSVPTYQELTEYSIEDCELPHRDMHYMESGGKSDPDYYIRMLKKYLLRQGLIGTCHFPLRVMLIDANSFCRCFCSSNRKRNAIFKNFHVLAVRFSHKLADFPRKSCTVVYHCQ